MWGMGICGVYPSIWDVGIPLKYQSGVSIWDIHLGYEYPRWKPKSQKNIQIPEVLDGYHVAAGGCTTIIRNGG